MEDVGPVAAEVREAVRRARATLAPLEATACLLVPVRESFGVAVFGGHFFVFFTRRMARVRIVDCARDGMAMWTKRLEKGRYRVPLRTAAHSGQRGH